MGKLPETHVDIDSLTAEALQHDRKALGTLLRHFHPCICHVFWRLGIPHQQWEDLAQGVALKVIENLSRFKGESSFKTWVISIARHHAVDFLRQHTRRRPHVPWEDEEMALQSIGEGDPAAALLSTRILAQIAAHFGELTTKDQNILTIRCFE